VLKVVRLVLLGIGLVLLLLGIAVLFSGFIDKLLLSVISSLKGEPPKPHWLGELRGLGGDALLSGVIVTAFSWLVFPRETLVISLAQKRHFLSAITTLTLAVLWLPAILRSHTATIAGQRYWWLFDDAMISMRYARNLANGIGLVWNPGERVEGYTNFLWTAYMTLVQVFPIPDSKTSLVVLLTNIVLAVATIPVISRLVRVLGGGTLATVATLAGYSLSGPIMYWTASGLETMLLTLALLLATLRVLDESTTNEPRLPTYLLLGILPLIRADAIMLSALLLGVSLFLNNNRRRVLIYCVISLLLPVVQELLRIYYYNDILPNTAYLKTTNWSARYIAGLEYVLVFLLHYSLLIAFAIIGAILSRSRTQYALIAACTLYAAYVAYIGGDSFFMFRFFTPILPLLMALAFVSVQNLWSRRSWRLIASMFCLVTMPLIVPGYSSVVFPSSANTTENYGQELGNVRIGLLLKQNTPPTSKVADFWAGQVFYFSERHAVDLLGKSDRHVARLPAVSNGMVPGHNKFDFGYSVGVLKPDFVVANNKLPVQEDEMRLAATGDYAYTGQLYFNPVFREHCLSNPVPVDTWRTIFVCDWSHQVAKKEEWEGLH
jgi:hypothetical protein